MSLAQNKESLDFVGRAFLYNEENVEGTARYRAMSGAMGALGGDLSAVGINPAGGAVFLSSSAAITLGVSMIGSKATFGASRSADQTKFGFNQGGLAFVFNDRDRDAFFKNWVITANYTRSALLNSEIYLPENRNISSSTSSDGQRSYFAGFHDVSTGYTDKFNLALSTNYRDRLYLGVGVDFYNLSHDKKNVEWYEYDSGRPAQDSYIFSRNYRPYKERGTAYAFNVGFIYRPIQELRLGMAYHSPLWWKEIENVYISNEVRGNRIKLAEYGEFLYDLNAPGRIALSGAYLFGKQGLVSLDYTYKMYGNTKISSPVRPDRYDSENAYFDGGVSQFRIGGEYRLGQWRFRAGYRHEQSPFESQERAVIDESNREKTIGYVPFGSLNGFSLGLGYGWKNLFVDLSYDHAYRDRGYIIEKGEYIKRYRVPGVINLNREYYSNVKQSQGNFLLTLGMYF